MVKMCVERERRDGFSSEFCSLAREMVVFASSLLSEANAGIPKAHAALDPMNTSSPEVLIKRKGCPDLRQLLLWFRFLCLRSKGVRARMPG